MPAMPKTSQSWSARCSVMLETVPPMMAGRRMFCRTVRPSRSRKSWKMKPSCLLRTSARASSSSRASETRSFTSSDSFSVCAWALSIHFCRPTSSSSTFRLVAITVSGVFSSWLASVMNCFCFSTLFIVGSMAFLEKNQISR